ncbi:MAG: glycosyltransferase family 4 protein [Methylacidiphilales bacterium]|nr:glycosyltransferase family 4 protein [Candidatus Methylacidiphilales bacterium]
MGLSQNSVVRVLLINQVFHPDPQATGLYLGSLAESLVKRGHQVTVLTSRRCYDDPARRYPARETWRGIEIIRVWNSGCGHEAKWRRAADFFTFLFSASLRGLFLPPAAVVVALTTPPLVSVLGAALAKLWQCRLVYWVMDLNPDEAVAVGWLKPQGTITQLLETASRWSLRQADSVIVLDDYMRQRVTAKAVAPEKIVTVPIWMHGNVRYDREGRERFRQEQGLENKFVVMYSGNHTPCHPLEALVEAARLLRDDPHIHFCFIGGGTEWRRLRDLARAEAWPNATFLGYQPFATLSASLSAADVQVVVMGDAYVGIVHPCKVYNFLAAERPFVYIGPERSHVADLIREAGLEEMTASFRQGESRALAEELLRRAVEKAAGRALIWPPKERLARWTEPAVVEKIIFLLENPRVKE